MNHMNSWLKISYICSKKKTVSGKPKKKKILRNEPRLRISLVSKFCYDGPCVDSVTGSSLEEAKREKQISLAGKEIMVLTDTIGQTLNEPMFKGETSRETLNK